MNQEFSKFLKTDDDVFAAVISSKIPLWLIERTWSACLNENPRRAYGVYILSSYFSVPVYLIALVIFCFRICNPIMNILTGKTSAFESFMEMGFDILVFAAITLTGVLFTEQVRRWSMRNSKNFNHILKTVLTLVNPAASPSKFPRENELGNQITETLIRMAAYREAFEKIDRLKNRKSDRTVKVADQLNLLAEAAFKLKYIDWLEKPISESGSDSDGWYNVFLKYVHKRKLLKDQADQLANDYPRHQWYELIPSFGLIFA